MLLQDGQWNWNHVLVHSQALDLACNYEAREQMFHTILNASHACFTLCQKKIRDQDWIQLPETLMRKCAFHLLSTNGSGILTLIFLIMAIDARTAKLILLSLLLSIDPQSGVFHGALRGGHLGLRFLHSHIRLHQNPTLML